jgi:tetratricopeptide (TPR) repeat protein
MLSWLPAQGVTRSSYSHGMGGRPRRSLWQKSVVLLRFLLAVLVIGVSFVLGSRATADPPARAVLELAHSDDVTFTPSEIVDECTRLIDAEPKLGDSQLLRCYELRGNAYAALKNWKAANVDFDELVRLSPGNPLFRTKRATSLVHLGRIDQAIRELESIIADNPKCSTAYVELGLVKAKQGELEKSIQYETTAISIPDEPTQRQAPAHAQRRGALRSWRCRRHPRW